MGIFLSTPLLVSAYLHLGQVPCVLHFCPILQCLTHSRCSEEMNEVGGQLYCGALPVDIDKRALGCGGEAGTRRG